jgi:hypothetical protein
MKKLVLALAVIAVAGFAPVASAQSDKTTSAKTSTECSVDKDDCCKGKPSGIRRKEMKPQSPFESLNLTTEQKGKLEALNSELRSKREAARKEIAAGDSVMHVAREDMKREYLKGVKEILTVDQYIQFLEDHYVKSQDMNARGGKQGIRKSDMRFDGNGPKKIRVKESADKAVDATVSATPRKK